MSNRSPLCQEQPESKAVPKSKDSKKGSKISQGIEQLFLRQLARVTGLKVDQIARA